MNKTYLFLVAFSLGMLGLAIFCTPPDETPAAQNLNEIIAGKYTGIFRCVSYTGSSWVTGETGGSITLSASGADSLVLTAQEGNSCLILENKFVFSLDTSYLNPFTAISTHYSLWTGNYGQYNYMYFYPENDSLVVTNPWHSSYGWLGREFLGKIQ